MMHGAVPCMHVMCVEWVQIVVATPGRLWELMQEGHAQLTDMCGLVFLVLDEADRMVQQGHFQVPPSLLPSALLLIACCRI